MNALEKEVLNKFKTLLLERVGLHELILFGSRARGDADLYSDMDVVVILDESASEKAGDDISDCAWEAGFVHGIVVVPVVFSRHEWEEGPERFSLLAEAVKADGVII